jgi:hypothetical protein
VWPLNVTEHDAALVQVFAVHVPPPQVSAYVCPPVVTEHEPALVHAMTLQYLVPPPMQALPAGQSEFAVQVHSPACVPVPQTPVWHCELAVHAHVAPVHVPLAHSPSSPHVQTPDPLHVPLAHCELAVQPQLAPVQVLLGHSESSPHVQLPPVHVPVAHWEFAVHRQVAPTQVLEAQSVSAPQSHEPVPVLQVPLVHCAFAVHLQLPGPSQTPLAHCEPVVHVFISQLLTLPAPCDAQVFSAEAEAWKSL